MTPIKQRFFPEVAAGGFSRVDGTVALFSRVQALVDPGSVVVDFGAGRGRGSFEDPVPYRRGLRTLKGKVARVIGVDIDDAVLGNPSLDEAVLWDPSGPIPLADASVDLIVSEATFEHIADPGPVTAELGRILKPGGWICARTPNRWGYIGIGANLVPNRWHVAWLRHLQPHRQEIDVFPTTYRLNTRGALRRYFPEPDFRHCTYGHHGEPAYFGSSGIAWSMVLILQRFTPEAMAPMLMVFIQKGAGGPDTRAG